MAAIEKIKSRSGGGGRQTALVRWASYASVLTAGLLIVAKLVAWWQTDSVALLSSLLDSLLDVAASIMTLLAVRHSLVPADAEHRFGHGKAEALAAFAQAGLIAGSGLFLIFEATHRLHAAPAITNSGAGLTVMVLSIAATFALTRFQSYVVKKTGSVAIGADSSHYLSDLISNLAVMVALILTSELQWRWADPLFGIAVAVWIIVTAWRIGRRAYDMLMDRELPDEARLRILEIIKTHGEVLGIHDLRTRAAGPRQFIQVHLEMDGGMTLYRAHAVADAVEADLQTAFPEAEVIIHQDPSLSREERPRLDVD